MHFSQEQNQGIAPVRVLTQLSGNTSTIENLDPSIPGGAGAYFSHMVDMLVAKGGLERGVSVRGAPYDFRRTPTPEYVASLKALIEETSASNGNQRIVLVSVSRNST